jgi:hypothetical protein
VNHTCPNQNILDGNTSLRAGLLGPLKSGSNVLSVGASDKNAKGDRVNEGAGGADAGVVSLVRAARDGEVVGEAVAGALGNLGQILGRNCGGKKAEEGEELHFGLTEESEDSSFV